MEMLGRTVSGRGHSECKGPEVGEGLVGSVDREEASLAECSRRGGACWGGWTVGDEGRSKPGRALIQNVKGSHPGCVLSRGATGIVC